MKKTIEKWWRAWTRFAFIFGNFVSTALLFVFYYLIFWIFAIPFKIFGKKINTSDGLVKREKQKFFPADFKKEF